MVLLISGIYLNCFLLFLLLTLYCIYFCCSRQFKLIFVIGCCSFFIVPRIIMTLEKIDQTYSLNQQFVIKVAPDSLKINGDSLSFYGENKKGALFRCYYTLKNESEKNWVTKKNFQQNYALVNGTFTKGRQQRNLAGFNQKQYLRSHGYCGIINIKKITWYSKKNFELNQFRAYLIRQLKEKLPKKTSAYLCALFFGYKDQDFKETQLTLSPSGILHYFSISGMHVHIFLGVFLSLFQLLRLTLKESILPMTIFAVLIIVLTGGAIGIWRATLLFFLNSLTKLLPVVLSALDKFGIVLLVCLWIDPLLIFQTGGQLSFLISFLLLVTQNEQGKLKDFKKSCWLTLLALPIICFYFYEWPLLGGVLTVVLLPVFKFFLLPMGLLLIISTFVFSFNFLIYLFENFIFLFESILKWTIYFTVPIGWLPTLYVFFLTVLGIFLYQKKFPKIVLVGILLFLPILINRSTFPLMAAFIDVGQGDSILFKAPFNREVILVDTGGRITFTQEKWQRKIQNSNAQNTVIPFLKACGIKKINKLIITHGDSDHMGDLTEILHHFTVKELILGAGSEKHPNLSKSLKKLPRKTDLKLLSGAHYVKGYFPLQIFAPENSNGENEDSIVVQTKIRNQNFLLTGDLDQSGEERLLKEYKNLKSDVLKLGHHGSRTSSSARFIGQLKPQVAIVSCGLNNRFNHPHHEVLETLKSHQVALFRTDQQGMVYFSWGFINQVAAPEVLQDSSSP